MPLHVIITDLIPSGDCELTGKTGIECARVRLDEATPEAVIATKELLRILRFRKTQQTKLDARSTSQERKDSPQ